MSKTSSRIVQAIEKQKGFFTPNDIVSAVLLSTSKSKKSKKSTKVSQRQAQQTANRVQNAISTLYQCGFLTKQKGKYRVAQPFSFTGTFIHSKKGDGIVYLHDDIEVHIYREDVNHARNKDIVQVQLTDIRRGTLFGRVTSIVTANKQMFFARCVKPNGKFRILQLIDVPGNIQVITKENIKPGVLAIVTVKNSFIQNYQECTINALIEHEEEYDVQRIVGKFSLPGAHPEYEHLENIEQNVHPHELKNRKDYRKLLTVTIDGETAKDFDDAISIEYKNGVYTLYVHIADVSAYVYKDDAIDKEAYNRGTSYYLGNTVIPMLPEKLSNDLCSLKAGVDRLTLSVMLQFDKHGNYRTHEIYRGIINVDQRLTYNVAQEILNSKKRSNIKAMLGHAKDLAQKLKAKRLSNGRVDLNLADAEMIFDNNASIADIAFATRLNSHMIIEEFMLSANEVVSRVLRQNNVPTLYRIHEPIAQEKFIALQNFLKTLGIILKEEENVGLALQRVIDSVAQKEYQQVVNFIVLKSLMQAYYGPTPLGHFGLGFKDYTHFTSPIRRYPDLIVHRCIKSLIDRVQPPYSPDELAVIGEQSSKLERLAQSAERDLLKLKACRLLEERVGEEFEGIISGVTRFGFYVSLLDKPIEGMVPLKFLTDDYYLVNEDDYTVIGRRLGRRFRLGDLVKVRLINVDTDFMRIDFEVV
ncbi:MAG TPA: ribonuclease R [Spirochaetota bacterium]|nr:ribonuclease R [Spirochaetota bacterium]HOM08836.1 ribonuclease R [Spirochaetota bacterium]HPP49393.1 ribonuclease R [Spirochaetota bacterium]HXK65609.1 ribonuclease R [Spirochaetota bacterium]